MSESQKKETPFFDSRRFARSRKRRVALVLNIAPLYRKAIFSMLDNDPDIDYSFYAGEESKDVDALMDLRELLGFKGYLRNRFKGDKLIWQKGWWRTLFKKYDAYILTGNPGIRSNWLLLVIARFLGRRVYLWSHGLYGNESKWQMRKNLFYMNMADGILLYGNHGKQMLLKHGFDPDKLCVIYNSLDLERQKPLRDKFAGAGFMRNIFGNDNPTIAFIGRLTPQKQLHLLIEAVGILKLSGRELNIIFVGDGPLTEELEAAAQRAGIEENVFFYGECYDEEMIAAILQNSILTVSPGNVGLTAIQSLAHGVPVITHGNITTQMPEYEAVKEGVTGGFFTRGDSLSLSEKIETWVKVMSDEKMRAKVRENCFKMVDTRFNPLNQSLLIKRKLLSDMFPTGKK